MLYVSPKHTKQNAKINFHKIIILEQTSKPTLGIVIQPNKHAVKKFYKYTGCIKSFEAN